MQPAANAPDDLGAYPRGSGDAPSTISVPGLEKAAAFFAGIADMSTAPKTKLLDR